MPRGDRGSIFVERRGVDIVEEHIGICTLGKIRGTVEKYILHEAYEPYLYVPRRTAEYLRR